MAIIKIMILVVLSISLAACGTYWGTDNAGPAQKTEITPKLAAGQLTLPAKIPGKAEISFDFARSTKIASDQLAAWVEDEQGKHVRTLLVTRFTAGGGYQRRPEALPDWQKAFRPGEDDRATIDAFTVATPKTGRVSVIWDCLDQTGRPVAPGRYIYKVEANIQWEKTDLWQGEIIVSPAAFQNSAQAVKGSGSILKAVDAAFTPAS